VSLLAAAQQAGIALLSVCGGAGLCDSCRVRVVRGTVSPLSSVERDALEAEEVEEGYRLACQVKVAGDLTVDVPLESLGSEQRLQIEFDPQIADPRIARDPQITRTTRMAWIEARAGLGLAVDIGTTKIAAYLVDLASGRTLSARGAMNPQIAYGEDVISRIAFADRTPDGARTLHDSVIGCLNDLADGLCSAARVSRSEIREAVLVGNTVMHHLAVNLAVATLGRSPYRPVVTEAMRVASRDIGLPLGEGATAYLPPNLAGYVGADHVAMLSAIGAAEWMEDAGERPVRLAIDIGTNTEVSLSAAGRLLTCSCASGPAFEGAHISCGMRAAAGAIERVRVAGGRVCCQTIGGVAPIGICGSGVLDAVAELTAHGALDRHGGFRRGHPLIAVRDGRPVFRLASADATGHNRPLELTRQDVSEIQLAKAAIRTGIRMLVDRAGIQEQDLDEVIVAGAFGTYVDLASARRVGMVPDLPAARFRQVGNAAGAGARQMLVRPERRAAAEALAARVEHVDLTADRRFTDVFASALGFEERAG
jgi:uncharacterized 2Fe-2S/4Fe-4S cluster protein (DUF4445 family)